MSLGQVPWLQESQVGLSSIEKETCDCSMVPIFVLNVFVFMNFGGLMNIRKNVEYTGDHE